MPLFSVISPFFYSLLPSLPFFLLLTQASLFMLCLVLLLLYYFCSLFSLFLQKKTHNNFHPFNGYDGFSVPAQHHFPLFSKLLNTLYIDWRISLCHVIMERFSMKLP